MPIYEYSCDKCGHKFEITQKMSDAKLVKCEQADCGGELRLLFSLTAPAQFKGTGWYETDYKKKN